MQRIRELASSKTIKSHLMDMHSIRSSMSSEVRHAQMLAALEGLHLLPTWERIRCEVSTTFRRRQCVLPAVKLHFNVNGLRVDVERRVGRTVESKTTKFTSVDEAISYIQCTILALG